MTKFFQYLIAATGFAMIASPAAAQFASSSNAPMYIDSEYSAYDDATNVTDLSGYVQIVQGDSILTADNVKVFGIGNDMTQITANGNMRFTNPEFAVSGNRAVYTRGKDLITVYGNVVVLQGKQIMAGDKLEYFVETKKIKLYSGNGDRVRGVFYNQNAN